MMAFLWFIVGLLVGGSVALTCFCCMQLCKFYDLEADIRRLKKQQNND